MDSRHYPIFACTDFASGGTTIAQAKTIPLIWSINNFNQRVSGGKIGGPYFKFHPRSEELWRLELFLTWSWRSGITGLSLDIAKVSECNSTAKQFTICWSAERYGENKYLKKNIKLPTNVRNYALFNSIPNDFIKYFFDGTSFCNMVIQIEINDYVSPATVNSVKCDVRALDKISSLDKGKLAVLADMESILKDGEFTDIALRSEGKEIRAHRAILAARSAVFKSMFQHQMSEKASGSVDIPDVPHDTLQLLVTYMYSGRLVDLDLKSASELFVASDKYAVEDLHDNCSQFLKISLNVGNCLEILMLSDTHSNEDLKSLAVSFFSEHSKEICQIPHWENVIAARPNILLELLKMLVKK